MAQFQVAYKKRTEVEDRPGFHWENKCELMIASSVGHAFYQLFIRNIIFVPGRVVELE